MTPSQERNLRRRLAFAEFIKLYPFTIEDLDGEEWRPIEGYEGYQVSNFGRVKSLKQHKPRILKPSINRDNYLIAYLFERQKMTTLTVHRLVAKAFIPNPDNKPQVNHRDGCKINACATNLEWVTNGENLQHAFSTGLKKAQRGEENGMAKLKNNDAVYIRENPEGLTLEQLAREFGIDITNVSLIQRGKTFKEAGGKIRKAKKRSPNVPEEIKEKIRAEYVKGDPKHSARAIGRKFGYDHKTILNIIHAV